MRSKLVKDPLNIDLYCDSWDQGDEELRDIHPKLIDADEKRFMETYERANYAINAETLSWSHFYNRFINQYTDG